MITMLAMKKTPFSSPRLLRTAFWTLETSGPSQTHKVMYTTIFSRKPFIKFLKGSRIVNATYWM